MKKIKYVQRQWGWILTGLVLLMVATRFHHFGSVTFLPDASLAVFFLSGLYLCKQPLFHLSSKSPYPEHNPAGSILIFVFLIMTAGLIDYSAIHYGGVSDWCVTPAYLFLIPTYAAMFAAGYWCQRYDAFSKKGVLKISAVLLTATFIAFLISNGSFYLFSERFTEMGGLGYWERVSGYFIPYAGYAFLYSGLVLLIHAVVVELFQPDSIFNSKLR